MQRIISFLIMSIFLLLLLLPRQHRQHARTDKVSCPGHLARASNHISYYYAVIPHTNSVKHLEMLLNLIKLCELMGPSSWYGHIATTFPIIMRWFLIQTA